MRKFIIITIVVLIGTYFGLFAYKTANANIELKSYNYTIGCVNLSTYELENPKDGSLSGCNLGPHFMRIMAPTKTQWEILIKTFGTREKVINILPIINSESQFNHKAIGFHRNGKDCGIVQIRDIYGGCKMTMVEQFEWLNKRIESQKSTTGTCRSWLGNSERMIRCIYNRHNGQKVAFNGYDNKLMLQRKFYMEVFKY